MKLCKLLTHPNKSNQIGNFEESVQSLINNDQHRMIKTGITV